MVRVDHSISRINFNALSTADSDYFIICFHACSGVVPGAFTSRVECSAPVMSAGRLCLFFLST